MRTGQRSKPFGENGQTWDVAFALEALLCEALDHRECVLHAMIELVDEDSLAFFCGDFFGYVVALNEDAIEFVRSADGLEDEFEVPFEQVLFAGSFQQDAFATPEIGFAGFDNVIENVDETLFHDFRQRFAYPAPFEFAFTGKATIGGIGHYETVVGPGEYGDETGSLLEQGAQSFEFLRRASQPFLDHLRTAHHAGGVAFLDSRDLDRVLQDEFDRAGVVEERDMRRAPDMRVHASRSIGNGIMDMRDLVGLTGGEDVFERALELFVAFALTGECLEQFAATNVVPLAIGNLEIGLVRPHEFELAVEQHVRIGRVHEHPLEIDRHPSHR